MSNISLGDLSSASVSMPISGIYVDAEIEGISNSKHWIFLKICMKRSKRCVKSAKGFNLIDIDGVNGVFIIRISDKSRCLLWNPEDRQRGP